MKKLKSTKTTIVFLAWLHLWSSSEGALLAPKLTSLPNQYTRNGHKPTLLEVAANDDSSSTTDDDTSTPVNGNTEPAKKRRQRSRGYPLSAYELDPIPQEKRSSLLFSEASIRFDFQRSTRLLQGRSYAKATAFEKESLLASPSVQDLASPRTSGDAIDKLWSSTSFRLGVFLISFNALPLLTRFLSSFETTPLLDGTLSDKLGTGITILYSTFISLTLSILYERQKNISAEIAKESSTLVLLTRNILEIFKEDEDRLLDASDCISNQVRIIVKESRGTELLTMMYSDPYIRILDLLKEEYDSPLFASTQEVMKDLVQCRAQRLVLESSALPPTHFFILTILTGIIFASYVLSILPCLAEDGAPSFDAQLLFATFISTYILFYNFANDLNNPFSGVYQIRRSSIAAHLLEAKRLMLNNPLLKDQIDFETYEEEDEDIFEDIMRMSHSGESY